MTVCGKYATICSIRTIDTSIFDFPTLIEQKYIYVDKTAQMYELARPGSNSIYYLPRPRRFGKSLMISTYKALFQGRRELFKGLAIEKTDWDWDKEVYPVLHLDMSNAAASNVREFESRLEMMLRHQFTIFDFVYNDKVSPSANFIALLDNLPGKSANGKYVLLIDEYDAPIAGMLDSDDGRKELAAIRKALHDFILWRNPIAAICAF